MSDFSGRKELYQYALANTQGFSDQIDRNSYDVEGEQYRAAYIRQYMAYYDGSQYDDKVRHDYEGFKPGTQSHHSPQGRPYTFRERQPRVMDHIPKVVVNRSFAMLMGSDKFPNIKAQDNPDLEVRIQEFLKLHSLAKQQFCVAVRKTLASGSHVLHFSLYEGELKVKVFDPRYSRPTFNVQFPILLDRISIIYDFWKKATKEDESDKRYWFRMDVDKEKEVVYEPLDYSLTTAVEPTLPPPNWSDQWKVKETTNHNHGFCPVLWMKNTSDIDAESIDGKSLYHGLLQTVDEVNYMLSQKGKILLYNANPQTYFTGLNEQDVQKLRSGPNKTWVLPKDGDARFLEMSGKGLEHMANYVKYLKRVVSQNTRVLIDDPEEIQGWAVSSSAIAQHFKPMFDLIDELRDIFGQYLVLAVKMMMNIAENQKLALIGKESLPVYLDWRKMTLDTPEDLKMIADTLAVLKKANAVSNETIVSVAARHFPIDDIDEELSLIEAQKEQAQQEAVQQADALNASKAEAKTIDNPKL